VLEFAAATSGADHEVRVNSARGLLGCWNAAVFFVITAAAIFFAVTDPRLSYALLAVTIAIKLVGRTSFASTVGLITAVVAIFVTVAKPVIRNTS